MVTCKRCGSEQAVKNGKARGKARYRCKACGLNFVEGDGRVNESLVVKKALAVIYTRWATLRSTCWDRYSGIRPP